MNKLIIFLIASFLSSVSVATVYTYTPLPNTDPVQGSFCDPDSNLKTAVSIDSMTNLIDGTKPVDPDNDPPVYATGCYAVSDPNNDFQSTYDPNTGVIYEGMYNGDPESPHNTGYYVDPNIFLTHVDDQWVDEDTPGWISLATVDVDDNEINDDLEFNIDYSFVGIYDLDDLLDITFGINDDGGFWSLGFDVDADEVIDEIEEILGRSTVFDHLSFMFKGPSHQDWYMYDFNFRELIAGGLAVDLNDPHYITGSWDSSLFFGQYNVSHIEIVAHDPPSPTDIPAPQSSMLFAIGIFLLALGYKMKV